MDYTGRIITKNQVVPTASSAPGIWTLDEAMQYTKQGKWPPGYQISRSVRLRSSASAYFNRTTGSPTSSFTFTHSFWVKRGALGANQALIAGARPTNFDRIYFMSTDTLLYQWNDGASNLANIETTQVFRDPSAWYHFVFATDTTQATAADRVKIYVNGVQITAFSSTTYPAQNSASYFNTGSVALNVGRSTNASMYFDGYLTEINFIDGQALTPASFGYTDTYTGVWQPAPYNGTYGANGFYLNFKDPTSTTTIAYDYSGNSNNWTANNISVTAGTTYDSMVDVPINYGNDTGVGGSVRGNYAVLNALDAATAPSDGNLRLVSGNANYGVRSTIQLPSSGKWYAECIFGTTTNANVGLQFGFATASASLTNGPSTSGKYGIYADTIGYIFSNTTTLTSGLGVISSGTVLQIAYDGATGNAWVGKANVWYNSSGGTTGDPATGANPTFTSLSSVFVYVQGINGTQNFNAGQTAFSYTAPSGYQALCTQNISIPTILNGANYMAASLYTGTGSTQSITNTVNGISFQPDFVWTKPRVAASSNALFDSVRGASKILISNSTGAESNLSPYGLTAFNANGFSLSDDSAGSYYVNGASGGTYSGTPPNYVGWNWKGGGTAVTNTSGTITSSVSANTTAGFSVVTYTSTTGTVGHGLGVAPSMIIMKGRNVTDQWTVGHAFLNGGSSPWNYGLPLQDTAAIQTSSGFWNNTAPTSTVFSQGSWDSGYTKVAYCFAAIAGYSAFGLYTGNGSTDGPFIYLGFRPRFVLVRDTVNVTYWEIGDSSRNTYNAVDANLYPNSAFAEAADPMFDFLANGFKVRKAGGNFNNSGAATIYAAFAENPFTIARAR